MEQIELFDIYTVCKQMIHGKLSEKELFDHLTVYEQMSCLI